MLVVIELKYRLNSSNLIIIALFLEGEYRQGDLKGNYMSSNLSRVHPVWNQNRIIGLFF